MQLIKSLNDDSPGITEAWIVPTEYSLYSVHDLEGFIVNPFSVVLSQKDYEQGLKNVLFKGKVSYEWKTNKYTSFQSTAKSNIEVLYDNKPHTYLLTIPAGGTEMSELKLNLVTIPGDLQIISAKVL